MCLLKDVSINFCMMMNWPNYIPIPRPEFSGQKIARMSQEVHKWLVNGL